ncbi:MAG: adenylate kinase [Melioribacteraceae bacterium]|nr:adenylate kinase [Melioribacteraceae bacterium]
MQIVIFGAPGAGKGTQAKILSNKFNIPHISTGDILRDSVKRGTQFGLQAKETIEKGELVSDDLMGDLVMETLQNLNSNNNGFILDGFPRTVNQAEILLNIFRTLKIENPYFVVLEADDTIIISRLSMRRACTSCKAIVNLHDIKNQDVCPNCGEVGTLYKRKDDEESVIMNRLKVYSASTMPVLDFYRDKFNIITVKGTDPIDIVTSGIIEAIEK